MGLYNEMNAAGDKFARVAELEESVSQALSALQTAVIDKSEDRSSHAESAGFFESGVMVLLTKIHTEAQTLATKTSSVHAALLEQLVDEGKLALVVVTITTTTTTTTTRTIVYTTTTTNTAPPTSLPPSQPPHPSLHPALPPLVTITCFKHICLDIVHVWRSSVCHRPAGELQHCSSLLVPNRVLLPSLVAEVAKS